MLNRGVGCEGAGDDGGGGGQGEVEVVGVREIKGERWYCWG